MVIFDKGDTILKSVDFTKDTELLIYQLQHAETVPDRADAAVALGGAGEDPDVVSALGKAAQHDPFWGVRAEALKALGRIGGAEAEQQVLAGTRDDKPWVREVAARTLGNFKQDSSLWPKLTAIATNDPAYRARTAALISLAEIKAPNAFDVLVTAVNSDSPDDMLRNAALDGFGKLGDERAIPILREWSAIGKPFDARQEAIASIAGLDRNDKSITKMIAGYLSEPYFDVRLSAIFALADRGDTDAIEPLQDHLTDSDVTGEEHMYIERTLEMLKGKSAVAR
jgi:aminopeptidase N